MPSYNPPRNWSETEITLEKHEPPSDWSETEIILEPSETKDTVNIQSDRLNTVDNTPEVLLQEEIINAVIGGFTPNSNIETINQTSIAQTSTGKSKVEFEIDVSQAGRVLNSAQYQELIDDNEVRAFITSTSPDVDIQSINQITNHSSNDVDVITFVVDKDRDVINSSQV